MFFRSWCGFTMQFVDSKAMNVSRQVGKVLASGKLKYKE